MTDLQFMRLALRLARRGYGATSPNPMVGAVLVKGAEIIGRGWHRRAGWPHAEIEALRDAERRGRPVKGATLYVTLEPCCTQGRTPPCTTAIIQAGIRRVVIGATDPNPVHAGRGFKILHAAGIEVVPFADNSDPRKSAPYPAPSLKSDPTGRSRCQTVARCCTDLNAAFNHWVIQGTPLVTVKAAMTLDGKIATASGESKWITGEASRAYGMKLRQGSDAILVGVNTILADNPSLTVRTELPAGRKPNAPSRLRRIILDSQARTPVTAKVVNDEWATLTTIVSSQCAPKHRLAALAKRVNVVLAPTSLQKFAKPDPKLDLGWLLKKLGAENVTSLLVEGGGEVNASFLLGGFAHRVAFFYAPKILGGHAAHKSVAGNGATSLSEVINLNEIKWKVLGDDLLLTASVVGS